MGKTNSEAAKTENRTITITRVFDAPRELVFKAWTDPEHFAQWYGPDGFTVPKCEMDVRPGGAFLVEMKGPDGTLYPTKGVFREVVEPERLVVTSTWVDEDEDGNPLDEMLNTVTFEEHEGKTKMTLEIEVIRSSMDPGQALAGAQMGWGQSFEKLAAHLAAIAS